MRKRELFSFNVCMSEHLCGIIVRHFRVSENLCGSLGYVKADLSLVAWRHQRPVGGITHGLRFNITYGLRYDTTYELWYDITYGLRYVVCTL